MWLIFLKFKGEHKKELMDYIGIHPNVFTDWKAGKNNSYLKHISAIAEFLGVTTDYILEQKNKPTTNGELNPTTAQIVDLLKRLTPEEQLAAAEFLRLLADKGSGQRS